MSTGIDALIAHQLTLSERRHHCLVAVADRRRKALRRRVARGMLVSPFPGCYARPDYWNRISPTNRHLHVLRSLAVTHPNWVFCGISAAVAYGILESQQLLGTVHVACTARSRTPNSARIRRTITDTVHVDNVDGIRVTSLMQTIYDCVSALEFIYGLAVTDAVLRATGMSRSQLAAGLERFRSRKHFRKVMRAVNYADGASENAGESMLRAAFIDEGFEPPELQVPFADLVDMGRTSRVDYLWCCRDGRLIAGELDGRAKYRDPSMTGGLSEAAVKDAERIRESRLTLHVDHIIRFHFEDIFNRPHLRRLLTVYSIPRLKR